MATDNKTSGYDQLSMKTSIFGLHLWAVIGICAGAAFVLLLVLFSLWFVHRRKSAATHHHSKFSHEDAIPSTYIDIQEIRSSTPTQEPPPPERTVAPTPAPAATQQEEGQVGVKRIQVETGKDHRITYPEQNVGSGSSHGSLESRSAEQVAAVLMPEVSHLGWGHWYTLRELEDATKRFADEKVIGEGGYGIVYHGVLEDGTQVAIKNLLNNRGQAEKEFKVEVEAIGRVRHKNLVRLLGYCVEGSHRMLVYEYLDNGNLEQWLHGDVGSRSPLTWNIRMNVILGTAKGLMYLHEGLEPKVIHRDIKASNILLDKQWNAKVSDFGLAKLLSPERTYVTTRVMGTFGYVSPEYSQTGMLNERSDIYSFGILIMEMISGRKPIDYSRPAGEVNLVEWLKVMVSGKNSEGVLDPKLPEQPNSRALKRTLLVALRCVDPDSTKRPKIGHVINMLEVDDFPYRDDHRAGAMQGKPQRDNPRYQQRLHERKTKETADNDYSGDRHPIEL